MPDSLADELRLRLALKASQQGAWEFDLTTGRGYRSPELIQLLGVGNAAPTLADYLSSVHHDDRPAILNAFAQLRSGQIDEAALQYRLVRDDGQVIWVEQHTYAERGERGAVTRLYGLSRDVTSARQTELELQELNANLELRVAERTRELESERAALDAFAAFTETAGSQIDALALARHATDVLRRTLGEVSVAYYELEGGLWRARVWSDDFSPQTVEVLVAGIPVDARSFREAVESRQTVFTPGWDAASAGVAQTEGYGSGIRDGAGAFYPCFVEDEPQGMLVMGMQRSGDWTLRQQTVFRSVGRSLTLALERADAALKLREQNRELAARTRALEVFADLTRDLALSGEPYGLVRRAQEVTMSLLPPGVALYYELRNETWFCMVQTGDLGNPGLQAAIDGGLPYAQTGNLLLPWTTGEPYYQDVYDQQTDRLADMVQQIATTATLTVTAGEKPLGVLAVALFEPLPWTVTYRAVLETTVRSLSLALERAEQASQFEEERAALMAFTAFTEQVGNETEVLALVRRAMALLQDIGPFDVSYFELQDGMYQLRAWGEGFPEGMLERSSQGFAADQPSFVEAAYARQATFFDDWDAQRHGVPEAGAYSAVALQPFFHAGEVGSMLVMATRSPQRWSERDRGVFRAVGRSLSLALERAEQARQLGAQRDALDARTHELTAANEELEAFAYSASHDLRTPVRHVMGFTELAKKALESTPNPKVTQSLDVVQTAAVRMNALIDAMLMLSRTVQHNLTLKQVALNTLVAQAQRDVGLEFGQHPVRWDIQPLPQVLGDPNLLQQVMTNLLGNAVKYSRTRAESVVTVWAEERAAEWAVSVRDNGVGFDPDHAQKLFGVFQRLHSQREFEGTGVGLATVRRIVLKHGGRVSATSKVDEGATFTFTLPKPR
ncbi:ATP-binding protein [Deinococcus sp. UYEF24]